MTKQEAINYLSNTKVYVDGKSEEIQKKLFELGFGWGEFKDSRIYYICHPFIYILNDMKLGSDDDMKYFTQHKASEIKADDILNLKIDKECKFKPFDKVLVRNYDCDIWMIDLFERYDENDSYPYLCLDKATKECIPYEGNEYLLGTTIKPE